MPDKVLKTIKPRKYQQEIYEKCKDKNCLVILPTGIGKTLIALMLSIYTQKKYPGSKTLFLAPTRPLAEQHLNYFKKHLPELFAELNLFTGKIDAKKRKELWEKTDIIFSTPQCIGNDIRNNLYKLSEVSLLIEDECHRCLKNYSYTYVAEKYKEQSKNPKILGLTASPGTDKNTIEQIAKNLGIDSIEIRTRESEDVKEYLQELQFNVIKVDFSKELIEIVELIREIQRKKIEELKNRKLLFKPANKISLLELQGRLMAMLRGGSRNFNVMAGISACTQAIKLSHLLELLQTQTIHTSMEYIKSIFEQAKTNKSKAVKQIIKNQGFNLAYVKLNELYSKGIEHPKLAKLKEIVQSSIKENPKHKSIVFSQYRESGMRIAKELNLIQGINARVFVGQTKKGETGLSQKEQHAIIEDFKDGKINFLVSTSIGEEGLDIPEVNSVIFYEPIPSAIRKIQRAGRTARLMKGSLTILVTENTLDEIFYYASINKEKKMYKSLESIKKDLADGKTFNHPTETQTEINTKQTEFIEDNKEKQDEQKRLF